MIAAPLRTPDGGTLEVFATSTDAWTEEDLRIVQWLGVQCGRVWNNARLRDDLERQRVLLRTVTDHASAALFLGDAGGRCTYMNPAAERLAGVPARQARGMALHDLLHARGDRETHDAQDCPLVAGAGSHEDLFVRPDGSLVPVVCSVVPVHRERDVTSVVVEVRDMSDVRRHEAERETLLASERAAREQAELACRARDEFVATLSHELRTPLNAVLGWATLLLQDPTDPEEVRSGVEVIERNARHQAQLISDLLDMSSIVAGKVTLRRETVDPGAVVAATVESVRPSVEAKGLRLECSLDAAVREINADPDRLQQVVLNLLTNAAKFTPEGGLISVSLTPTEDGVVIEVADDGKGIEPALLPHMFDRYRQVDPASTRRHGGLGIGLAIVKHLVELHDGTVRLSSPGLGKGTTCTVRLPARAPSPLREPEAHAPRTREPAPSLAGLTVLVVDDEEDARSLVARFLRGRDATARTAASADEALGVLCADEVHMLISDIGMPGADGYSLMRRVRAECPESTRNLPAIALTAFARSADRTQALNAGFHAHVSKPVDPDELLATIVSLRRALLRHPKPTADDGEAGDGPGDPSSDACDACDLA